MTDTVTPSLSLTDSRVQFSTFLRANQKAPATVMAYTKDIEQFAEHLQKAGRQTITEVSSESIDDFKNTLKLQRYTSKSISRKINSIKAFFRFLVGEGFLLENPAEVVIHPHMDQVAPRILSRTEYRALRDACRGDVRMAAIVELLLQTGMRISELAAMQLTDLDMERGIIQVQGTEGGSSRRVPLNSAAQQAMQEYLQIRPRTREKTVFLTKTCRPFLVRNIRTAIDRYFRMSGIKDAKVNDLRHTFIIEQLKAGTPLVYVSQLVGHKRITTTEKYLKLVDSIDGNQTQVKIEEL
jgi:site-specific recombinase XerD